MTKLLERMIAENIKLKQQIKDMLHELHFICALSSERDKDIYQSAHKAIAKGEEQ